jgi:hypothetical protein
MGELFQHTFYSHTTYSRSNAKAAQKVYNAESLPLKHLTFSPTFIHQASIFKATGRRSLERYRTSYIFKL